MSGKEDIGRDFKKSAEERGRADEARWAREQDQEAMRKLREQMKKDAPAAPPPGPAK